MTAWQIHGGDYTSLPWPLQQELFRRASAALDNALALALDRGESVVVDSTMCKLKRRRAMRDICLSHGADPLLVYMPATYDTLRSRLARRQGDGPDDIIIDDNRLRSFCEGFEVPGDDESPFVFG